jgi:hypothetical protein
MVADCLAFGASARDPLSHPLGDRRSDRHCPSSPTKATAVRADYLPGEPCATNPLLDPRRHLGRRQRTDQRDPPGVLSDDNRSASDGIPHQRAPISARPADCYGVRPPAAPAPQL